MSSFHVFSCLNKLVGYVSNGVNGDWLDKTFLLAYARNHSYIAISSEVTFFCAGSKLTESSTIGASNNYGHYTSM